MMASAEPVEGTSEAAAAAARASKGLFVVFEGIDGSGKSTVSRLVFEELSAALPGRVVLTAEPTDSFIGDAVRHANSSDVDLLAEGLLFVADRAEHTRQIRAWLEAGKVVLCDRYAASTIAYQGALLSERLGGTRIAVDWLKLVNEPAIIAPDLTLLLTVKVSLALKRLRSRRELTKFEEDGYLGEVDLIYRSLAMEDRSFVTLDASRPAAEVAKEALRYIRSKI
ncbi:MAG: dTMP kinase [Methanomassiliicoccales archaeon]|nr:dTMP kinase [Methanomassiliicoccales archaeon]